MHVREELINHIYHLLFPWGNYEQFNMIVIFNNCYSININSN